MFALHAIYVDYQQNRLLYGANGVPALLAIDDSIFAERYVGIVEDQRGGLKSDAVLPLVDRVLSVVPFKSHRYTNCITLHRDNLCPDSKRVRDMKVMDSWVWFFWYYFLKYTAPLRLVIALDAKIQAPMLARPFSPEQQQRAQDD